MKVQDLNKLKGTVKDGVVNWSNLMVDRMFPEMPKVRAMLKRAAHNAVVRYDDRISSWLDAVFLFVADEYGSVDTDAIVDCAIDILDEMPVTDYSILGFKVKAGKGEIVIKYPQVFPLSDREGVRFSREDFAELKNLLIN